MNRRMIEARVDRRSRRTAVAAAVGLRNHPCQAVPEPHPRKASSRIKYAATLGLFRQLPDRELFFTLSYFLHLWTEVLV